MPGETIQLTPNQVAILQWIADGKRSEDVALLMNIESANAVDTQVNRILNRIGAASRASAVAWALRRGIIK